MVILSRVGGDDLPDGQNPVQPLLKKYSDFPKTQISL
jgi:hypothetical protein